MVEDYRDLTAYVRSDLSDPENRGVNVDMISTGGRSVDVLDAVNKRQNFVTAVSGWRRDRRGLKMTSRELAGEDLRAYWWRGGSMMSPDGG